MALGASVLVLYLFPFFPKPMQRGRQFNPFSQFLFWVFVRNFFVLTYIGACPVEYPFDTVGLIRTVVYFLFYAVYPLSWYIWDSLFFRSSDGIVKFSG